MPHNAHHTQSAQPAHSGSVTAPFVRLFVRNIIHPVVVVVMVMVVAVVVASTATTRIADVAERERGGFRSHSRRTMRARVPSINKAQRSVKHQVVLGASGRVVTFSCLTLTLPLLRVYYIKPTIHPQFGSACRFNVVAPSSSSLPSPILRRRGPRESLSRHTPKPKHKMHCVCSRCAYIYIASYMYTTSLVPFQI